MWSSLCYGTSPPLPRQRFRGVVSERGLIVVSSVVLFELRMASHAVNAGRKTPSGCESFSPASATSYRSARRMRRLPVIREPVLEMAGTPIGPYDLLIAAQAPGRVVMRSPRE